MIGKLDLQNSNMNRFFSLVTHLKYDTLDTY